MEIALMQNDLSWLRSVEEMEGNLTQTAQVVEKWRSRLAQISIDYLDENERKLLTEAQQQLASWQTEKEPPRR